MPYVSGWIYQEKTCPLWESLKTFCQTEAEARFLHTYLSLVKDRQFPMLLPQVRVGIAERRRPDFVAFVPFHKWKYKWYAIQLDRAHPSEIAEDDEYRDLDLKMAGYEVLSLGRSVSSYVTEAKTLVERFE